VAAETMVKAAGEVGSLSPTNAVDFANTEETAKWPRREKYGITSDLCCRSEPVSIQASAKACVQGASISTD